MEAVKQEKIDSSVKVTIEYIEDGEIQTTSRMSINDCLCWIKALSRSLSDCLENCGLPRYYHTLAATIIEGIAEKPQSEHNVINEAEDNLYDAAEKLCKLWDAHDIELAERVENTRGELSD
jgi:hypothetical protein